MLPGYVSLIIRKLHAEYLMKRDCCAKMEKKTGCVQKRQVRLLNIREIARQAGLSIATISRVINHPETVAPETTYINKTVKKQRL